MRYKAIISYYGKNYVGWQKQKNGLSVQEVLESALSKTFNTDVTATASGRTDAGVHADGQVVHFDVETSITEDKIPYAVNTFLPDDVSMLYCEKTDSEFNARFSAKRKTYTYKLYLCQHRLPMLEETHEHIVVPLDIESMNRAARIIEGEHDFKCFEAVGSKVLSTVRTIYGLSIDVKPLEGLPFANSYNGRDLNGRIFNSEVSISVCGNGFLYNMVRIIAGTLYYVGIHKLTPEDVKEIIETKDRKKAGKTLAAKGLHLTSVEYN